MNPYYQDAAVTIYHGDCRGLLGVLPAPDLLLTDPPYGVGERTDRHSKGRGNGAVAYDFPPVHGDDEPFDPAHLLAYKRVVLFGANHYADRLPPSATWLVWDKLDGLRTDKRIIGFDDNADVELAWSNVGGPARLVSHRWKGLIKASERADQRVHPTQKPVAPRTACNRHRVRGTLLRDRSTAARARSHGLRRGGVMSRQSPQKPCRVCGYEPLERGYRGHPSGTDRDETECPRCLAQYALDDEGNVEFMFDLPGRPLPPERWNPPR